MSAAARQAPDANGKKFGPFWLMPGISRINGASYFTAAFLSIPMLAAISFLQPIMLKIVGVERAIQGTLSGDLNFYQEILVLCLVPIVGATADKVGRRPLMMLGIALLGLGYAFYPFADSVMMMYAYRSVFAMGVATVATTITIVNTDYVQDCSRGKWVAVASFLQGSGIFILTQLLRRLPQDLAGQGFSEIEIAKALFWGCTGICFTVFFIATFGLSRSKPEEARGKEPILALIRAGIQAARENSRIALGYCCAFAARGDVIVVGTFSFLWTQQVALDQGLGIGAGYARGGMVVGVIQFTALAWSLMMAFFLDKIDRTTGVIIAFALSAVGYSAFGFVDDPFSNSIFLPAVILGMGEASTIIASNALIGQNAPRTIRGAVLGLFALSGAFGILVANFVGGRLFDQWMAGGPFVLMGIINTLVLALAIYVRVRTGKILQ
jgi:MFS family permease